MRKLPYSSRSRSSCLSCVTLACWRQSAFASLATQSDYASKPLQIAEFTWLTVAPSLKLSNSDESLLRIRWIAILREQVELSLSASGGFHTVDDIVKALLVGANSVQLCSVLFQQGIDVIAKLLDGLQNWLEKSPFDSVQQLQGHLSYGNLDDPSAYERQNYLQVLEANS